MIFLIIGKACAGKTYFREYVKKKMDVVTFEASDYIKKAKNIHEISSTKELLHKLGKDYVAREIYNIIKNNDLINKNVFISGFRTLEEVDYVMSKIDDKNVSILVIETNNILCYLRNIRRKREDKKTKYKEFRKRQKEDAELGFYDILRKYKVTYIKNNLSLSKYEDNINKYINDYRI